MKARTIKIHLVEGTPNDIMTVEIVSAWTGKVLLAPRAKLAEIAKRPEAKRAGVYILVGDDPDFPSKEQVYIGESDDVITRLKNHNRSDSKDFWNHTLIIISKDEHLTKSLVRYLESRLIQVVTQARRATLNNDKAPDCPKLPESDVADMEYFLAQIQMLLPVLGFSFIVPAPATAAMQPSIDLPDLNNLSGPKVESIAVEDSPLFQLRHAGAQANAQEIGGEFVVLQGSTAKKINAPALGRTYVEIRARLLEEGKLSDSDQDSFLTFTENVPFNSPSAAAAVVAATNQSGRKVWKTRDTQQTYGDWQQSQVEDSTELEDTEEVIEAEKTSPVSTDFDDLAFDIIEDLGGEMDLMSDPQSHKWRALFTQEAYDIVKSSPDDYIYEKDGEEYVKVWDNENIPFIIHMRIAGIDNSISQGANYSQYCRRELDD